jgi:hypothetical protein
LSDLDISGTQKAQYKKLLPEFEVEFFDSTIASPVFPISHDSSNKNP